MKLNNRFIFGIISIVLALVIAFVALPTIARQTNGTTEIVRVIQPLRRGSIITAQDIEVVSVGAYNLLTNLAKTEDDVVGKYATTDLAIGDYIQSSKISASPISSDIILSSIPSGKVAISITVRSLASGLSDKLQTGDIIRIYHFLNGIASDIPELQFVQILSVTDSSGIDVDYSVELQEDEERRQTSTVTVLASPQQAHIITALENDGMAHVALINRGNEALAEELLEMQDEIIYEIYFQIEEDEELDEFDQEDDYYFESNDVEDFDDTQAEG